MENNAIITNAVSLISVLGGFKLIEMIFNRRKRKAEANSSEHSAETVAIENLQKVIDELNDLIAATKADNTFLRAKVEEMHTQLRAEQKALLEITKESHQKDVLIERLTMQKCIKRGCKTREPESDY